MTMHQQQLNESNVALRTDTKQDFVSPFANDTNGNGGMMAKKNSQMGLKAASHVSMDQTPQAHEYQPTCPCEDCQALLSDFTQYDILGAYVSDHLRYEAGLHETFGFVPCVGGPHGNAATRLEGAQHHVVTSDATVFFTHNMTMKPVNPMFKHNAHCRFYGVEPKPYYSNYNGAQQTGGSNNHHNNNNHAKKYNHYNKATSSFRGANHNQHQQHNNGGFVAHQQTYNNATAAQQHYNNAAVM